MNKKRTISIKDPRLQRIRNSLRYIISEAVIKERGDLIREKSETSIDDPRRPILADKRDKLDTAWEKSTCVCPICHSRTSDMTFNPADEYWVCVKCYQEHHEFYVTRARQGEIWKDGGGRPSTEWFP